MFTKFQLAKKYIRYFLTASNGKGHGVHSPFVFDFIKNVLNDNTQYACYKNIEKLRNQLLVNDAAIEVEDFGAGSAIIKSNTRIVKNIAHSSLKPKKYSQLLFRIVKHYLPNTILELGTSFGITTAYLASGKLDAQVYTCEGATNIAAIAQHTFNNLNLRNITLLQGDFDKTLQPLFQKLQNVDLAFVDGNHRKIPTLAYFEKLLRHSNPTSIFIFDDIHWSYEMEQAWEIIMQNPSVTLTIDLFFIGIVCINPSIIEKQHYKIRY